MKRAASSERQESNWRRHEHTPRPPQLLSSLRTSVSPPPRRSRKGDREIQKIEPVSPQKTVHDLAAIEAGKVEVTDHLSIFSTQLRQSIRSIPQSKLTILPICEWASLYRRNEHPEGCHFVIHQHDHPVAGPHYDLRLQFSESSSVSWSIMYGMPGDPNSKRLNRNATETRVHCLWVWHDQSLTTIYGRSDLFPEPSH